MDEQIEMKFEEIKNEEKISFKISNNPWINNGIFTLLKEAEFYENITVHKYETHIELEAENILQEISNILRSIASKGTYNLSQSLKTLNLRGGNSPQYGLEKTYPSRDKENKKVIDITKDDVKYLKAQNATNTKSKQQVWKQRTHYLSDYSNYTKFGMNLFNQKELKDLKKTNVKSKYICPFCNNEFESSLKIKLGFNPLVGEHHNNMIDGFDKSSQGRKNITSCPQCFIASLFALFNYKIPFFQIGKSGKYRTFLALPVTSDANVLEKITNNLGKRGQFIDFSDADVTHYSSNIRNNILSSKFGSIISLLFNITNKYHLSEIDEDNIWNFEDITEEEFPEITEWILIEKGSKIHHIKANSKIYNLLKPFTDEDAVKYSLIDSFRGLPVGKALEYDIEKFYEGFLKLETSKVVDSLFIFAKESIKNQPRYLGKFRDLKKYFLDKLLQEEIMLQENQKKALKEIAQSIAYCFNQEVGILTKFAYSTESKDFKNALEEALFKNAKMSALGNKSQYFDQNLLTIVMDLLDDEEVNFVDLKNYFICFMSANVITANYKKEEN